MPAVLLFLGLPLDVRETDLAELLTSEPTRLHPSSIAVTALYNSAGTFLASFLVEVGSDVDAEKVRRHYSGQIIDGSHTLAVQHVLPPNAAHPSVAAPAPPTAPRASLPKPAPAHAPRAPAPRTPTAPKAAPKRADASTATPPGLRLLGRMGKGGKAGEKERQKLLLERQRAALLKAKGKQNPGDALLSRLAKTKASPKAAVGKKAGGKDKVARAKRESSGMDVDKTPTPKPKPKEQPAKEKPKTQHQLDEEMKAYERQRRFANA